MKRRLIYGKTSRSRSGDTIVEVLIAIAVVSSVLAGAFTVTQKSTQAVRNSQEHAAMLQILQGQVELVRAIAVGDSPGASTLFGTSGYFCIDSSKNVIAYTGGSSPTSGAVPGPCSGLSKYYNVAIKTTQTSGNYTFTFTGWWDALGGGKNQMKLSYKIAPSS